MSKEDRVFNRYEEFNRLMSESNRETVVPELLEYVRAIFLEIVRVKYWQNIEGMGSLCTQIYVKFLVKQIYLITSKFGYSFAFSFAH